MPVFQHGKSQHKPDCFKPYNWREDLVKVYTFDLEESFCNKACTFTTIGFHIKYPLVINNLVPFGQVYQFIDFVLTEYIKLVLTCGFPFLLCCSGQLKNVPVCPFMFRLSFCRNSLYGDCL